MVRLGIKHGALKNGEPDMDGFYDELNYLMEESVKQLLNRFEYQCNIPKDSFKFLLGNGVWKNAEKIKNGDNLYEALKHGTLSIGFIGLAETLVALTGVHHGESKEAQEQGLEIINFMRDFCDKKAEEMTLNFSLIATPKHTWAA